MDIQPIKNEENYDNALAEIEALWGAEEGTEKGDKLDILLVLVEACEEKPDFKFLCDASTPHKERIESAFVG